MTSLPAPGPNCRNCGAAAPGQYCPSCGQETRVALPTVRELMRDAAGRLVAIDSRLWRTLCLLLFRPGMLTVEYLRGRRKRYVRPARLFFVAALLMFAVVRLASGPISVRVPSDAASRPAALDDGAARATRSTQPSPPKTAARLRKQPSPWIMATKPRSMSGRKSFQPICAVASNISSVCPMRKKASS